MAALFVWQPHVRGKAGVVTPDLILRGAALPDGTAVGADRLGSASELALAPGQRAEPVVAAVSARYGMLVAPALVLRGAGGDVLSVQVGRQAWRQDDGADLSALRWDEGGTVALPEAPEDGIAAILSAPPGHRRAALRNGDATLAYDPVVVMAEAPRTP